MTRRRLTEIWIYPVKSLGGIRMTSASVMEKGLTNDRRWMLIDDRGKFMTQRTTPPMALFKLKAQGDTFVVRHGDDELILPGRGTLEGEQITATIWDDEVQVVEASPAHSAWFSKRLGIPCRLVEFPEQNPRLIDEQYRTGEEHVGLADGYPLLVIGQASLDDLNTRLDSPVPMNRFRPNLVFTGGTPYEEDTWKTFAVGKNKFKAVKTCARCVLTTVNQDTAEKGREPLLTLSRYRKQGDRILFGMNVIPIDCNTINEGDEIDLF